MEDLGPPVAYLALEEGVPVLSRDGQEIGTLRHVLAAEDKDIFEGLIVAMAGALAGHRFADAEQVESLYEGGVVLKLDAAECAELPEPSENPAVVRDVDPAYGATIDERLAAKLRRAWDYLSGNY